MKRINYGQSCFTVDQNLLIIYLFPFLISFAWVVESLKYFLPKMSMANIVKEIDATFVYLENVT